MTVLKAHNSVLKANGKILVKSGGGGNTVVIGGRTYPTVQIGNQIWLAENLDLKASGIEIDPLTRPQQAAAWYYNRDEATYGENGLKYGLIYNWEAMKLLNDNRANLFPGWHVPTYQEWMELVNYSGGQNVAGGKLKSRTDWDGTDDFGFNALHAGIFDTGIFAGADGSYDVLDLTYFYVYSASSYYICAISDDMQHNAVLFNEMSDLSRSGLFCGMSIRLIKDSA